MSEKFTMTTQKILDNIIALANEQGMTLRALSVVAFPAPAMLEWRMRLERGEALTVSMLLHLARALGVAASVLLDDTDGAPRNQKRECTRPGCVVGAHDVVRGQQADFCRMEGSQGPGRVWAVGALSNGVEDPWEAWAELPGGDDGVLEGQAGIMVLKDALAAFTKLQALCDVFNEAEGPAVAAAGD